MSVLKSLLHGPMGLSCDTAACVRSADATSTGLRSLESIRIHAAAELGWSTDKLTLASRHSPHIADYCRSCTTRRRLREWLCKRCVGGELYDLMGHNGAGHRAAGALYRAGVNTTATLRELNDADLLEVRDLGVSLLAHVKMRLVSTRGTATAGSHSR